MRLWWMPATKMQIFWKEGTMLCEDETEAAGTVRTSGYEVPEDQPSEGAKMRGFWKEGAMPRENELEAADIVRTMGG